MGIAANRKQLKVGINEVGEGGRPTAIYKNDWQSAKDFKLWLDYNKVDPNQIDSSKSFLEMLANKWWWGRGVSRVDSYLNAFKSWKI